MSITSTSISLTEEKDILYSGFKLHKNGLQAIGTPTFEQWQECGDFIKKAEGSVMMWLGDWINYGKFKYGEKYSQALDATDYEKGTLKNASYVASRVDLSRRRDNLPFSIYQEIAPLEPKEQDRMLDIVKKTGATTKQIRKEKHKALLEMVRPVNSLDSNLILGDALKELWTIPDDSIDCLITDPPYGIDYQSNMRTASEQFSKISNDKESAFVLLDKSLEILQNKIKNNSHIYIFTTWSVYPKFSEIISKYFTIKNALIWVKDGGAIGDLEADYMGKYEMIIYASKGRRLLNGARESNVLYFNRISSDKYRHPTEKPVGLLEYLIEKSTNEGEIIIDPFMGSGSTCVAAKNKNRKYWGIEMDKQYFNVAQERIQNGND